MIEEKHMYNPHAGEVDDDKFWRIVDSIPSRFTDLGTVALIRLVDKVGSQEEKIFTAKELYDDIINELYKERIKELIEELQECIK